MTMIGYVTIVKEFANNLAAVGKHIEDNYLVAYIM